MNNGYFVDNAISTVIEEIKEVHEIGVRFKSAGFECMDVYPNTHPHALCSSPPILVIYEEHKAVQIYNGNLRSDFPLIKKLLRLVVSEGSSYELLFAPKS